MGFSIQRGSDQRTFRLVGELDLLTSGQLIKQLSAAMQANGDLRLDLRALEFVDSAGIRASSPCARNCVGGASC